MKNEKFDFLEKEKSFDFLKNFYTVLEGVCFFCSENLRNSI